MEKVVGVASWGKERGIDKQILAKGKEATLRRWSGQKQVRKGKLKKNKNKRGDEGT